MKCNVLMGVRSQTLVRAVGGRPAGLTQVTAIALVCTILFPHEGLSIGKTAGTGNKFAPRMFA